VQNDWVAILRFDCEANLEAWLNSPERLQLVAESSAFTDEYHTRVVRGGFDQWSSNEADAPRPPVWKQNMLALLMLYPVAFLFGALVQKPMLMDRAGLPFWLALFVTNAVSVSLLNWLVPFTSGHFDWGLQVGGRTAGWATRPAFRSSHSSMGQACWSSPGSGDHQAEALDGRVVGRP
jgi:antibiotic biosynthesis monooxygenase (ABM) superfamily enzyme